MFIDFKRLVMIPVNYCDFCNKTSEEGGYLLPLYRFEIGYGWQVCKICKERAYSNRVLAIKDMIKPKIGKRNVLVLKHESGKVLFKIQDKGIFNDIEEGEIEFTLDSNSIRMSISMAEIVVMLTKNNESIHYELSKLIKLYPEIFGTSLLNGPFSINEDYYDELGLNYWNPILKNM